MTPKPSSVPVKIITRSLSCIHLKIDVSDAYSAIVSLCALRESTQSLVMRSKAKELNPIFRVLLKQVVADDDGTKFY